MAEGEPNSAVAHTITMMLGLEDSSLVRRLLGHARRHAKVRMRLRALEEHGYKLLGLSTVGVKMRDVVRAVMRTDASPHHTPMVADTPSRTRITVAGTHANIHMGKTRVPIRVRIHAHVATPIPRAPTRILNQVSIVKLGPHSPRLDLRSCIQRHPLRERHSRPLALLPQIPQRALRLRVAQGAGAAWRTRLTGSVAQVCTHRLRSRARRVVQVRMVSGAGVKVVWVGAEAIYANGSVTETASAPGDT